MKKSRALFKMIPSYKGEIEGWTVKFVMKNFWRVSKIMEMEDVFQDCLYLFYMCKQRYNYISEPKHFMAIYKTCVINLLNRGSNAQTSSIKNLVPWEDATDSGYIFELADAKALNDYVSRWLLREDPILDKLITAIELGNEPVKRQNGTRETTKDFLSRILGVDFDMVYLEEALSV